MSDKKTPDYERGYSAGLKEGLKQGRLRYVRNNTWLEMNVGESFFIENKTRILNRALMCNLRTAARNHNKKFKLNYEFQFVNTFQPKGVTITRIK